MPRPVTLHRAVPLLLALGLSAPSAAAAQGIEEPRIPLRTALAELNTLRTEFVDAFNRKDGAALADMYATDVLYVDRDGSVVMGDSAARAAIMEAAPNWPHAVLNSENVQVYGNTAIDVGTWTEHPAGGGERVVRYMVVLRRGMNGWKIVRRAAVPVESD